MKILIPLLISVMAVGCFKIEKQAYLIKKLNDTTFQADLSADEQYLAINSENNIHLVSLNKDEEDHEFKMEAEGAGEIRFQDDKKLWVSRGYSAVGHLLIIDLERKLVKEQKQKKLAMVWAMAYSKKTAIFAAGTAGGEITLWDSNSGNLIKSFGDYETEIFDIKMSEDGSRLYSGNSFGELKCWDVNTGKKLKTVKIPMINSIFCMAINESLNILIVAGSDGIIGILNLSDLSIKNSIKLKEEAVLSCDLSKNGLKIVCGLTAGYISIFNTDGTELRQHKIHYSDIRFVKFFNEDNNLISVCRKGVIKFWQVKELLK